MVYQISEYRQQRQPQKGDKETPCALDSEEAVLGSILLDPGAIARIEPTLPPEAFYTGAHAAVYQAVLDLHRNDKPTDLISVTERLSAVGKLQTVGGKKRLRELLDSVVTSASIDYHAEVVVQKWRDRQYISLGGEIVELAFDQSIDPSVKGDLIEQKVFAATQKGTRDRGFAPMSAVVSEVADDVAARSDGLIAPGLTCGFYDLDGMTQGFQREDLIIVAGRPSMGKTAIAMDFAKGVAIAHRLPVAIFSLEMSKEQLVRRMLASETRIESGRFRLGRINKNEWEPIGLSVGALSNLPIFIDDTPNPTVTEIRSKARRLQAEQGDLGLILLDYLQLMEGSGANRVQELSGITRALKSLARELHVPVIALSQLSRAVEQRTNHRPMMSDLRESGGIEQDADLIMMLYRDEYYNPDTPDRGIAEVIITKHRNGPTGTVKLLFESQFTQFRNLAR